MLITLAAAFWRMVRLEEVALDHDEVYEFTTRTLDLWELAARHDGFPPLYRWLVSVTVEIASTAMAIRWFSLLAGVATIPVVAALGRRLVGPRTGVMAALFLAVSASHVLLSQHGRAYTFLILLASIMMLTAWRLRQSDRWSDWAAFLVSAWMAIAAHYYAGLLLLILGPLLLLEKRGAALRRGVLAAALLALAGLPLVACLRADLADSGEFFHRVEFDKEAYAFSYLWLVTGNTLGPSVSELRDYVAAERTKDALAAMAPWAITIAALVGPLFVAGWRRLRAGDRVWLAVLLIAPPIMAVLAAPYAPTGYHYRYIVWMVVPLALWLGAGASAGGRLTTLATCGLIATSVFASLNHHFDPRYAENDFHAVATLIEERNTGAESPAVIAAPLYYGNGVLYTLPGGWLTTSVTAHPDAEQDWDDALPGFAERLGDRERAWLVTQWFPPGHPQRVVCDALADRLNATLLERVSSTVMVYELGADDVR